MNIAGTAHGAQINFGDLTPYLTDVFHIGSVNCAILAILFSSIVVPTVLSIVPWSFVLFTFSIVL
jgi:hypothetical protein